MQPLRDHQTLSILVMWDPMSHPYHFLVHFLTFSQMINHIYGDLVQVEVRLPLILNR
jgi:hypothetical protein